MTLNKKASDVATIWIWIILGVIVLLIFFFNTARGQEAIKSALPWISNTCEDYAKAGYKCQYGSSCEALGDDPVYEQEPFKCKDAKKICCKPTGPIVDAACKGKTNGESCDDTNSAMVCGNREGIGMSCMSLCEFCSLGFNDPRCSVSVAKAAGGDKIAVKFTEGFKCGCTLEECNSLRKDGKCVIQPTPFNTFCSKGNNDFCCAK